MPRQYGVESIRAQIAYEPIGDANALRRFDNMSGIGAPGTPVGAYVFEIPLGFVNNMQIHDFVGYHYASGKGGYRFRVSFYAYSATPAVINPTVTYDSGVPGDTLVRPQVRIGRRIATGNAVIIINDIATNTYQYPRLHLESSWFSVTSLTETAMLATPAPVLVTDLSPYDLIVSPVDTSPGINATSAFNQGSVPIARGGTNGSATPTAGGVAYGTGAAFGFTAAGSAGQVLSSGGAGAPTWASDPDGPSLAPIRLVSSGNLALSGLAAIDGVTPIAGDRIGAFYQSTGSQNGIYVAASGAWSRATDADTAAEMAKGTRVRCTEGNQFASKTFTQINNYATLGTDTAVFRPFVAVDQVNAFIYPPPYGQGHLIYDTTSRTMRVWDGVGSWNMANGILQALSTGRPSGPSDGNLLYETDTGSGWVYGSSQWQPLSQEVAITAGTTPPSTNELWVDTSVASSAQDPAIALALNPPRANMTRSTALTLSPNAYVLMLWENTVYNPQGIWSSGSTGRFTITTPGLYHIDACALPGYVASNRVGIGVRINGSSYRETNSGVVQSNCSASISVDAQLAAGDYVEIWVYTNLAASTVASAERLNYVDVRYVCA